MNAALVPAASRVVATTDNHPPLVTLDQLKADFAHVEAGIVDLEAAAAELPSVLEDDEDLASVTGIATKLAAAAKRCEEIRTEQNRPYLDASKLLNDHFKHDLVARLVAAKSKLETAASAYLRKKAAREQVERDRIAAEARQKAEAAAAKVAEAVKTGDVAAATAAVTQSNTLSAFAAKTSAAAVAPKSDMARTKTTAGTAGLASTWTFEIEDINRIDLEALRPYLPVTFIQQALRAFVKAGRREISGARIYEDTNARFRA